MKNANKFNTPPYVRYLSRLTAPFPDFDFFFIRSVRKKAAELLELKPGSRVIDAGCGSGGSFPFLVAEVGRGGEVVGVEISPESSASAKRRIAKNKWENVSVIESPAEHAELSGSFDGLLMFAAPDVFAAEAALENIFPRLDPGARVVFFGAKTSGNRFGRSLNGLLQKATAKVTFATTPPIDAAPWKTIAPRLDDLNIKEYFFGWMFLASGTLKNTVTD